MKGMHCSASITRKVDSILWLKPMKHLNCPDCNSTASTKTKKIRIAFLGGTLSCDSCGAQLKTGGRLLSSLIGAALGTAFFYVAIHSLTTGSWLPLVSVIILGWCFLSSAIYFSRFERSGRKRFSI